MYLSIEITEMCAFALDKVWIGKTLLPHTASKTEVASRPSVVSLLMPALEGYPGGGVALS